jgi:hypothetical protein
MSDSTSGISLQESVFSSLRSAVIFGILTGVAGNHDESQRPLGSVVGWLYLRLVQESQQVASVVMDADAIQEPLIFVVFEGAHPQV